MTTSSVPEVRLSRRELLRAAALGAFATFLAACGSALPSPTTVPSASTPPSATPAPSSSVAAPSPSPTEPTASATPTPSPSADLRRMIAGLLIVGFRGMSLGDAPWLRRALRSGLGGVILFDRDQQTGGPRNVRSPEQVTALVRQIHAAGGQNRPIVSIDEEGGVVTRLSPAHGFPAVASEATVGRGTVAAARTWARRIAGTLASVGIDLNFAPVVDLDVNPSSPAIGALDRSFSADPDVVVEMAIAEIEAHRAAGVATTLKHFPGIGSSTTNTDFGVADVTDTWTRRELQPFRRLVAARTADLVMAGHVVNRRLDPKHPASLSQPIVGGILRDELGFDGVVVTDDLGAAAITHAFGRDEAILLALEAGDDLLLFANQQSYDDRVFERAVDTIASAVESGRLPIERIEEAAARIDRQFGRA
ncbi:MAG TPA: glycoside hydrolase family 3 N-terminal domain-containing protein [Candidatus Limnocylindrales bacterium]|nr:glycoside hydrolase family 3 N-terminal domain-containing protein [Candidatus Limnocylindrales bacterium]